MCTTEIRDLDMRLMRSADRRDQPQAPGRGRRYGERRKTDKDRERNRKTERLRVYVSERNREKRQRSGKSVGNSFVK